MSNVHTKNISLPNDPLSVFEGLAHKHDYCYLFETLADTYQPLSTSQSYIGLNPVHRYAALGSTFITDGVSTHEDQPLQKLQALFPIDSSLPSGYVGGLVGYYSHEGISHIEPSLKFPYDRQFYDFEFADYPDGLIFKPDSSPEYFYYENDRSAMYQDIEKRDSELSITYQNAKKDKSEYSDMIQKAHDDIKNGRVFQVVLANRYEYSFSGDLLKLYRELRRINPSPFMFFMKFKDVITIGASPELLVHTNTKNQMYLEALAGTVRRGDSEEEDAALAVTLLADEKEVAEHSMLVDLARNDVGRISSVGTVQIDDLMYIKKLSHVQHISSIVSGSMSPGVTAFDALASSFPAGTLSGAPKIESIKMIAELESYERGPYGGTIGYFSYNGESVHAVNIRSVSAIANQLFLHSGSGIVFDSNSDREFQEIHEKKAAMESAMELFMKRGKQ